MNHTTPDVDGLDPMEAYDIASSAGIESEQAAVTPAVRPDPAYPSELAGPTPSRPIPRLTFSATLRNSSKQKVSEEISEQIAVERSESAFQEFYEIVAPRMFAYLLRVLGTEDDALDVMQETFIQLWNKAPVLYNTHTNLGAWSHHLARNLALDVLRSTHHKHMSTSQSFDPEVFEGILLEDRTPEGMLAAVEASIEIRKALKKLKAEEQKSIELVFFRGFTQKQAAEQLSLSEHKFGVVFRNALAELEYALLPLLRTGDQPRRPPPISILERERKKQKKENEKRIAEEIAIERAAALRKFLAS